MIDKNFIPMKQNLFWVTEEETYVAATKDNKGSSHKERVKIQIEEK